MQVKQKLEGTEKVTRELDRFKGAVQRKITRRALMKTSRVVKSDMRAIVPREIGLLDKSLGEKTKTYKDSAIVVAIIGPRSKPSFLRVVPRPSPPRWSSNPLRTNPLFYANPLHAGSRPHAITIPTGGGFRVVQHPGHASHPFISITWQVGGPRALHTLETELWQGIFAEWNRP